MRVAATIGLLSPKASNDSKIQSNKLSLWAESVDWTARECA